MSQRLAELKAWLHDDLGLTASTITPASRDASFRRYFRISGDGESYIVMDAPPEKEDCRPFMAVAGAFARLGLNVPRILGSDTRRGFLLLSDLGSVHYLQSLNKRTVVRLYGDAMGALRLLQAAPLEGAGLPDYDRSLLLREMGLFRDWYLERHLGLSLSEAADEVLRQSFSILADEALSQPRVWVHRDFHSRNLMVTTAHNPGILDFQDAVIGPVTYDLVSMLRDCYISWPPELVAKWAGGYLFNLQADGILNDVDLDQFMRWFDLMGVQRHLKAIGIFSRLCHRDAKPGYLQDIPRTLAYAIDASGRYPELNSLHRLLRERVIP
jgi:aminoglycoside/choline kinase family phosphotransferase